jgi:hypothetical protein
MNRIIILFLLLVCLSVGLYAVLRPTRIQAAVGSLPVGAYFQQCLSNLNRTGASFSGVGGEGTVNVLTTPTCAWTAASTDSWITINSGSTGVGNGTVLYSIAANTGAARVGTMTIAGTTFTVSSAGTSQLLPERVRALPRLQSITFFERTGGTAPRPFIFPVNSLQMTGRRPNPLSAANSDFTGAAGEYYDVFYSDDVGSPDENGRYVTIECEYSQPDGALNIAEVNLNFDDGSAARFDTVASFLALGSRALSATAANAIDGDLQTHTTLGNTIGQTERLRLTLGLTLFSPGCTFTISPGSAYWSAGGSGGLVRVFAPGGCSWIATSNASWLVIVSGHAGAGDGLVTYEVRPNKGGLRSGTLTIAERSFTVTQEEGGCPVLEPRTQPFLNSGGSVSIQVHATSDCTWSATSDADWITIISAPSGIGSGTLTYSVAPNSGARRVGTIRVNGKPHTVIQSPDCEVVVNRQGGPISADSGAISPIIIGQGSLNLDVGAFIEVWAPAECTWGASSFADWIRLSFPGGQGSASLTAMGNKIVFVSALFNNDTQSSREGFVEIAGRRIQVIQGSNTDSHLFQCLFGLIGIVSPPSDAPELAYAFRDDVLARSPRGRAYTKLYYDHASEAVRIAMLNPVLILRSREILERYKPVIQSMVNGQGATFTDGDLDEIDAFITSFAERGSSELLETVRELRNDLRNPDAHREFGIRVIKGSKRELSGTLDLHRIIYTSAGLSGLFGVLAIGVLITKRRGRRGAKTWLCGLLAIVMAGCQWPAESRRQLFPDDRSAQAIRPESAMTGHVGPAAKHSAWRPNESILNLAAHQPSGMRCLDRLPLRFELNRGQADSRAKFVARMPGYSLLLTPTRAVMKLKGSPADVLTMKMVDANPDPPMLGLDELPGASKYFAGKDPNGWQRSVPSYRRVKYVGIYKGIDAVCYGNQGRLEYDFIVAAGGDPATIRLGFEEANRVEIDAAGDLELAFTGGEVRQYKPVVYQELNGVRREISAHYTLIQNPESELGNPLVGFEIGNYDRTRPLIIDPVLTYSTYVGGSGEDQGAAIAVDSAGNTYVTGFTGSLDFPSANPQQPASRGDEDAFVLKFNPSGNQLLYATYLGGSGRDNGSQIAVDAAGNAYVTGVTDSIDFPVRSAIQPALRGTAGAFVTRLGPTGDLLYSTYLGGGGLSLGTSIAVDAAGNTFVAGATTSPDFPTVGPFQAVHRGATETFVAKLNSSGTDLVYSTYLGGSGDDIATGLAVDAAGNIYVSGVTTSRDLRTTESAQKHHGGGLLDGFVAKLNSNGSQLEYCSYLGGRGNDRALANSR